MTGVEIWDFSPFWGAVEIQCPIFLKLLYTSPVLLVGKSGYMIQIVRIFSVFLAMTALSFVFSISVARAEGKSEVKANITVCNETAKTSLKAIRQNYKAGVIDKTDRKSQIKTAEKTRRDCVRNVIQSFKSAKQSNINVGMSQG